MLRNAFAIVSGLFAMMIVITFTEMLNVKLFPLPPGLDPNAATDLPRIVAAMPLAARLMIVGGWCVGALAGAAVAARLATHRLPAALLIGAWVTIGTWLNARAIPHPAWMTVTGIVLPLPLAWLATRLVPVRKPATEAPDVWRGYDR